MRAKEKTINRGIHNALSYLVDWIMLFSARMNYAEGSKLRVRTFYAIQTKGISMILLTEEHITLSYCCFMETSSTLSKQLLFKINVTSHYIDVIMTTMATQITSLTVVYSTVYSDADQRKHQSSTSLAFVWGIHRDRWIPRTKGQLRGKCFYLMTSSCESKIPCFLGSGGVSKTL